MKKKKKKKGRNKQMQKFKEELTKNMKWFFFSVAIVFIFMGGFYLNEITDEIDTFCSDCFEDTKCSNDNLLCGDFGIYKIKVGLLVGLSMMGVGFLVFDKDKYGREEKTDDTAF